MTFQKQPIPWPEKPVYQISLEGVKVCLLGDGRVFGWTSGYESAIEVARFTFQDSGNPWIPKHKNFNSFAKKMMRDGDFDELLKFRKAKKLRKQNMSASAEDMYAVLERVREHLDDIADAEIPDPGGNTITNEEMKLLQEVESVMRKARTGK